MSDMTIAYLPYIECQEFKFGQLVFRPFYNPETQKLFPSDVLEYLNWYLPKHVDSSGAKKQIVVISFENKILGPWSDTEKEKIRNTVEILCFLSIWKIDFLFPLVPENFTLYIKNFTSSDRTLATRLGGYISTTTLIAPEDAEEVRYVQPETVRGWNWITTRGPWEKDHPLFDALSKSLINVSEEDWFRRLILAIKIFNTSFNNTEALQYFDRVLLIVTAFQTILGKDSAKGKVFAQSIVEQIGTRNKAEFSNEINNKLREFSERLYIVRSKYAHGNKMDGSDIKNDIHGEYYQVSMNLFGLIVKYLLIDKSYLACSDRDIQVYMDVKCGLFRLMEESGKNKS